MQGTKGINKAFAVANAIAKKSTKVVVTALPIMSVAANAFAAAEAGTPQGFLRSMVRRYTGFDPNTGKFSAVELGMGAGTLIGSTLVSYGLKMLT